MRHRKIKIAAIAIAAAGGFSGIVAAAAVEMSGSGMTPAASPIAAVIPATAPATIHTQSAMVGGKTETVFDAQGLPLYYYKLDTPTKSFVSGALASFWQPLVSFSPTISGASGNLSVTHDSNGAQVAYNGHFLYSFADDSAGHASGQGVEDFSVATPGLTGFGTSQSAPTPARTSGSGMGWGY
jgi:predicted lipoprotein with Yx(FWY)xxD motif